MMFDCYESLMTKDWKKLVCKQENTQWGDLKAGQVMADA